MSDDPQAREEFGQFSKDITEGWGQAAYGPEAGKLSQTLRGEANASWLCHEFGAYFIAKFESVCGAAGESACKAAWAA